MFFYLYFTYIVTIKNKVRNYEIINLCKKLGVTYRSAFSYYQKGMIN